MSGPWGNVLFGTLFLVLGIGQYLEHRRHGRWFSLPLAVICGVVAAVQLVALGWYLVG